MIIDSASHEWEGIGGCLDIHQSFGEHNYAMRRKVRRLLVEFKADRNDGVSLIEMVPETIFKP